MTVGKFANFRSEFDKYNPYLWGKISHNISYTRRRRTLNPRRQAEEIADGPDRTATANLDETAAAAGLNKTGAADTTSSGTDDGTCYLDNDDDEQVAAASSPTVDKKRNDVIQELIKTERNYSEVLNSLLQDFAWPLSDYFRPQHSACIFLGIQELAEMHAGFRSQLRKAKGGAALGQVFLDWREKFLIYGDYCANLTTAQSTLNDVCSHNEALNQEVIRCQQRSSNDEFKLRDLLTVPIQRVLNYHVLLDKLVEETPCEWVEDRKRLVKARNAIQNLRNHMDSCSTDRKRLNKIERLQGLITNRTEDIPLMHHGRILKQGRLKIRTQSDQRFKNRYVILFEKAMLVCKVGRGNHYRYHQTIKLDEYYIKNTPFPGYWLFIHNYGSPKIYICVHHTREYGPALCDELKNQWLKKIKLCLYHLEPFDYLNCDHKFRYYQFEGAHLCATCQLHLIGYLRQGYKCLECGECAHRECIPHSKICMPELTPPPQPTPLPNPFERELTAQLWYVGVSSWKLAEEKLEAREDGTYMVRARPPRTQPRSALETSYALCVKADGTVKHIRIFKRAVDGADLYFLSKTRFFKSVVELVQYYERVSLTENFEKLDQRLQWPYRRIVAEALLHYQMGEPGELVLYKGCKVILLSKGCDGEGTWRGTCANQVGSFPKEYVIVIEESI